MSRCVVAVRRQHLGGDGFAVLVVTKVADRPAVAVVRENDHDLTQEEAATLLGVDRRTIIRRNQEARLRLHRACGGGMPVL